MEEYAEYIQIYPNMAIVQNCAMENDDEPRLIWTKQDFNPTNHD